MNLSVQSKSFEHEFEPSLKENIDEFIRNLKMHPIACKLTDSDLISVSKLFLRARKYDCKRALELYEAHHRMRLMLKLEEINPLESSIQRELLSEKFTVIVSIAVIIYFQSTQSTTIALFNARKHWPPLSTDSDLLKCVLYQVDSAMSIDEAQKNGITFIYNMLEAKYTNFDLEMSLRLLNIFTGSYPARLRKVLIVGPPFWFRAPFRLLQFIVRDKIRDRVYAIDQSQLNDHMPINEIPDSLGGNLVHDHQAWIRECLIKSNHIAIISNDYFTKAQQIQNQETNFERISSNMNRAQIDYSRDLTNITDQTYNSTLQTSTARRSYSIRFQPTNKSSTDVPVSTPFQISNNSIPLFARRVDASNKYQSMRRTNSTINSFYFFQTLRPQTETTGRSLTIDARSPAPELDETDNINSMKIHYSRKRPNYSPPRRILSSYCDDYIDYTSNSVRNRTEPGTSNGSIATNHDLNKLCSHPIKPRIAVVVQQPGDSLEDGYAALDPNSKTIQTSKEFLEQLSQLDAVHYLKSSFERKFSPSHLDLTQPCHRFKLPENIRFNRYLDVICIDKSAVVLSGNKYIHANWVHGYKNFNSFILTQGPLEETCSHLWQMVWETSSPTIVMLTKIIENGRKKCHQYWPSGIVYNTSSQECTGMRRNAQGQLVLNAAPFEVRLLNEEVIELGNYVYCDLEVINTKELNLVPLRCKHFLYLGWPDFDVPADPKNFLSFLDAVNKHHAEASINIQLRNAPGTESAPTFLKHPPIIVHCSAGIGRTGTYVAIDVNIRMIQEKSKVDVFGAVHRLRQQRVGTVQVPKQFIFIYEVLRRYIDEKALTQQ